MGLLSTPIGLGAKAVRGLMDMSTPARMERAEDMGFDTDTTWYHGTNDLKSIAETGFDPNFTGKGNDQFGSGFYFSTRPTQASSFATNLNRNKAGEVQPAGVVKSYLALKSPLVVDGTKVSNVNDLPIDLSSDDVRELLEYSTALKRGLDDEQMNPMGDQFAEFWDDGPTDEMMEKLVDNYTNSNLSAIEGDLFDGDATAFREGLAKVTGYDGIVIDFGDGFKNAVAWKPEQVRSTSAKFDSRKANRGDLVASRPEAAIGGLLALTAMGASEDADAGVVGKSLDNIIKAANKQGVKLDVFENKKKGGLELSRIVVPEKSKGVGTSIMNDLAEYADKTGQTVSLSPSTDFGGTSKRRLTEFYKRFGFVQNKGKNKDYTISNSMYRSPSIKSSNPVATTSAGLMANVTGQPSNLSSYMQGNTDAYLTNAERQYLQNKQAFESNFSDDTGWDRADILPFRVNEQTGEREFATPEMIKGLLSGLYDIGQSKNTKISNPASLLELI